MSTTAGDVVGANILAAVNSPQDNNAATTAVNNVAPNIKAVVNVL